jgi:hypothetical protein
LKLTRIPGRPAILVAVLAAAVGLSTGSAQAQVGPSEYTVTVENLMTGQPVSPPVFATHNSSFSIFSLGGAASADLEAIAEDGDQSALVASLLANPSVTDVVDVGEPLTRLNTTAGSFEDAATFTITASPGDRLSFAGMLICTNDGFMGLNGLPMPKSGNRVFWANAYDAGTEDNTEVSEDLVDPCTALGPAALPGDPDGNVNVAVDTTPHGPIALHTGIAGTGELSSTDHDWLLPVVRVTVTRNGPSSTKFIARLAGYSEVRNVEGDRGVLSPARGAAGFKLDPGGTTVTYKLTGFFLVDVTAAHIHKALPDDNGGVVVSLFSGSTDVVQGTIAEGTISVADLSGVLAGDFGQFLDDLRNGQLYVNVHTVANAAGEIRGQIGTKP